jgi:alpha-tubulin suppressor-like RCC1 family protein
MSRPLYTALVAGVTLTLAACSGSDAITTPVAKPPVEQPGNSTGGSTAPVGSVALTPAGGTVFVGRTMTLVAAPKDAAGNALTGRTVTWASSADSIARVDANGIVTGVATGTAIITAAAEGKTATATLAVQLVPVSSVLVTPATANLRTGDTLRLAAATRDSAGAALAGREVRWTSSAPAVATVDSLSGLVRAAGGGSATITATSEGKSGTAALTIAAPTVPVATVAVTTALDTLEAYDEVQLQAVLRDASNNVLTGRTVRWTTSDAAVATVDSISGKLTGIDRGTVTVTATSETKSGTATRVVVIKYRSLSAGTEHACDIASGGLVWCWGRNGTQLRIGSANGGDQTFSSVPVRLNTDVRFKQLSTFGTTTCGVSREGRAYCWGYNGWGNLGNGTSSTPSATPVAVSGGLTFKSVSLGAQHSCGVTTDDRVYCWGFNQSSEFGNNTSASSNVPVLAAGGMSLASISAGDATTCGLTAAGAGWCWGHNGAGQLGDGLKLTNGNTYTRTPSEIVGGLTFRSISASQSYTCGLTTSGQGYCWGSGGNRFGSGFSGETSTPRAIPGFTWKQLSPGSRHACGVTTDDDLYCWGSNGFGQLGNAIGTNGSTTPVRAGGSLKVSEVSAANIATGSAAYTCTISADRLTTYCFGRNDFGQLGNGATSAADASNVTPTIVVGQKPLPVR